MEIIDLLIRLLIGFMMTFFFGVSSFSSGTPSEDRPGGDTYRSTTHINSVNVLVQESFPMQVQLEVTGEHADGCDYPVQVDQRREGNTVIVEVYREIPIDIMCPMILLPYNDTIQLDGTFEPGEYVFIVNDFVVEQTL